MSVCPSQVSMQLVCPLRFRFKIYVYVTRPSNYQSLLLQVRGSAFVNSIKFNDSEICKRLDRVKFGQERAKREDKKKMNATEDSPLRFLSFYRCLSFFPLAFQYFRAWGLVLVAIACLTYDSSGLQQSAHLRCLAFKKVTVISLPSLSLSYLRAWRKIEGKILPKVCLTSSISISFRKEK